MLTVAAQRLGELHLKNWSLAVADHRRVPAPTGMADVAIAGWRICCLTVYSAEKCEQELDAGLDELNAYYSRLFDRGFRSTWTRTDYRFQDGEEATDLTTFFGSEPVAAIQANQDGHVLPECTGIWRNSVDRLRLA